MTDGDAGARLCEWCYMDDDNADDDRKSLKAVVMCGYVNGEGTWR